MTVYVDDMRAKVGRMQLCHMVASTPQELFAMADMIRMPWRHFQRSASFPHFDICQAKKRWAIEAGAIAVTRKELARTIRDWSRGRTAEFEAWLDWYRANPSHVPAAFEIRAEGARCCSG